ncbi:MAG: hypothetical protein PQ964_03725 [Methanobacteriaceae archaeon]
MVKITVRGKRKKYKVIKCVVELENIGKVKLIISRGNQKKTGIFNLHRHKTICSRDPLHLRG